MQVVHLVAKLARSFTEINFKLFLLRDLLKLWTQYPGSVVLLAMFLKNILIEIKVFPESRHFFSSKELFILYLKFVYIAIAVEKKVYGQCVVPCVQSDPIGGPQKSSSRVPRE